MGNLVAIALAFPTVVWTVLLGVVLIYWLFVVLGAVHLGSGHADGALDGLDADGAVEGAAKGAAEGLHSEAPAGADGADGGADVEGHEPSILASLKLRSVPVTVVVSLIVIFAWMLSTMAMQACGSLPLNRFVVGAIVLPISALLALPLASIAVRPLARFFAHTQARTHQDLVGKTCQVRTGSADGRFGEATITERGSDLVVRVRIDGQALKRGQDAIITGWDHERDAFTVEPLDEVMGRKEKA